MDGGVSLSFSHQHFCPCSELSCGQGATVPGFCIWVLLPHILSCCVCFLQQTKERVKLLIQLADGFCEKGHAHAAEIKKCVTAVDKRYRDFSLRMEKYRTSLEKALGISSDSNKSVNGNVQTEPISVLCMSGRRTHPCPIPQSKSLQLDIIPASIPGSEVKLRDAAHELNEEKRKSARRKE